MTDTATTDTAHKGSNKMQETHAAQRYFFT